VLPYPSILDNCSIEVAELLRASMAINTWRRHISAWNSFEKYLSAKQLTAIWPLTIDLWGGYIVWAVTDCKLKSSTVKTYLSSLKLVHTLKGIECLDPFKIKILQMILTGAENLEIVKGSGATKSRKAFSLPLLKLTGHRIGVSDWPSGVKQIVWTALTLGFFTGVRLGEILSETEDRFDPTCTLLWKDILFRQDGSVLVHIKLPKVRKLEGDFIDIFEFPSSGCCPVASLKCLKKMQSEGGYKDDDLPVFCFPSGRLLTTHKVNLTLKNLLSDLSFNNTSLISCHSLRAAIPTHLAPEPDLVSVTKTWGRWSSPCYQKYVRHDSAYKKKVFDKIRSAIEK